MQWNLIKALHATASRPWKASECFVIRYLGRRLGNAAIYELLWPDPMDHTVAFVVKLRHLCPQQQQQQQQQQQLLAIASLNPSIILSALQCQREGGRGRVVGTGKQTHLRSAEYIIPSPPFRPCPRCSGPKHLFSAEAPAPRHRWQ